MPSSKSNAKTNWFSRFWQSGGSGAKLRNRRKANRLRLEKLESRQLLAAILLDIPGINGDTSAVGSTSTDITLTGFSWGFSRGGEGARASLTAPIKVDDLQFTKPVDSVSNDLYAQANFAPIYNNATRLRFVDDLVTPGKNQLNFELTGGRLTSFGTDGKAETGSLSFGKVSLNESVATIGVVTNRVATWDLLSGGVTTPAIVGPGNIDNSKNGQPTQNPLNIETVLEIGGQKLLIDDFSWRAETGGDVLALPGSLTKARGGAFQITRDVDSGTAGLLGSAAAGTNLGKVTVTDRTNILGVNKVTMQWNLYDAFVSDFKLIAKASELPTNKLGLFYSKIELTVTEFNVNTGVQGNTLTTTWDEAGNVVTPATTFGTADPSIADTAQVASYLDFGTLGRVRYDSIDWLVSKPTTVGTKGITQAKTKVGAMEVKLAAGPATPALLGSLAKLTVLPSIAAKEQNTFAPTSDLNTFALTNAAITEFSIKSEGLAPAVVSFSLDAQSVSETFNARKIPLITSGNFNEVTGTSTGVLSFGAQNAEVADRLFELEITEDGITSKIPVTSAKWSASRPAPAGSVSGGGDLAASTFDLTIPRGIHSPGLFAAAARGTTIDKAVIKRYEEVEGEDKVELYQWELTDAFLTDFASHMRPGNSSEEIDRISFNPSSITLKTPEKTGSGPTQKADQAAFDFSTGKFVASGGNFQNTLPAKAESAAILQMRIEGRGNFIAIDSYSWGAELPVDKTTETGARPLGDPDASALSVKVSGLPSAPMLGQVFNGKSAPTTKLALPSGKAENPAYLATLTNVFATAYAYQDEISATRATNSLSLAPTDRAELEFTPLTATGLGTPRSVNWDLAVDSNTTQTGGLGGFQFAPNSAPPMVLEFFNGTTRSQVELDGYAFGTANKVEQAVGKSGSPAPLASRGISTPGSFKISTRMDQTTPGLFAAIALKTKLPEIKIIERGNADVGGVSQFVPVREWTLRDVYIENLGNAAQAGDVQARVGTINLSLNPGSAESTLITYGLDSKAIRAERKIDFVTPPTPIPFGTIAAISTDPDRLIDLPTRFTDQEATSTLRYTSTVVSGANLFDSVTVNSLNRLVLNYKAGQSGFGQVRVDATDSFGLVSSLLVNVAVDVNGITGAPAGTNQAVSFLEDSTYTVTGADFGFTDPNDFPANMFTGVTVTSLPSKGSLRLNNVAVTANQLIPIANINSGQLKYTPLANENGNAYSSFQFQVRDNGTTNNVDLSPNTMTFNVTPVNDAPGVLAAGLSLENINEDTTNSAGVLVSIVAASNTDVDAGAVKGIAVIGFNGTDGIWQFALDGVTWQNFGAVSPSTARLLASDATTRVRFVPNANFTGVGRLDFRAWDRTAGTHGAVFNITATGGATAFSTAISVVEQFVVPVNDAPTLNTAGVFLPQINEDTANPAGALVSSLLTGMSDVDAGAARGIAVRSVQNSGGVWQYSLNGGTNWTPFGSVTPATARLLPADANTRVRFVPNPNFNGNRGFSFYAWDQTSGTPGGTVDLSLSSAKGGTTAFSTDIELTFATQVIAAVNDLPNIAAPTTAALVVNTPLVFSTANSNALSVSDIDAGTGVLQIAFTAPNARFTLSTLTGITVTAGSNGTSAFTVRGTLAALNAALAGSSLVGNVDYFGTGNLRLDVNDLGNTGSGGPKTRGRTIPFTISALPAAISLGELNAVSTTGIESGSFTAGTTASRFYSFTLPTAADVRLVLSGLTGNANLRVLTTTGGLITQGINPGNFLENVLVSSLPAGTYIVAVKPTGLATSFNLSVSTATASDNLIVNANDLGTLNATTRPTVFVSDSVSGVADRQDYFKFTTTAASPLRVSFSGLSDNYDIHLLNANGAVVSSNVLPGTNIKTIARSNLVAGTYFIRVSGFANRNLSSYDLSVSLASTSDDLISQAFSLGTLDAATLPVVRRVAPSVGSNINVQDYNSFVLTSPSDVRINLTGLSQDIDMQLLDSFGRPIGFGSNGGNSSENVLATGLAAGTYYVRVAPFQNAGSTYELSVALDPLSDDLLSNAISLGALSATVPTIQRTGNVNFTSDRTDYYSFTLGATTDVRVNLSGLSGDADIVLEDSFGRLITSSSQSGNSFENLIAIGLTAGTYSIRVFTGSATTSTNYLLAVSQLTALDDLITNATMLGTLTSGTLPTLRTVGSAGGSDIQDYHRFNLTTAGNLRFTVSNMSSDLDVELLDQFGQVIISGTQNGNTIERVLTPTLAVGTYYIRVFQKTSGGPVSSYTLEITTDFNGDDIIGPRTNLGTLASTPLTSSGSVGGTADTQDYFSFTLTSTRNVRFQLTGLSGDIDIQVFNAFGNLIGSGAAGGSTSEDITLNGLLAGVYYIRIFPFSSAVSNYLLSVTGV